MLEKTREDEMLELIEAQEKVDDEVVEEFARYSTRTEYFYQYLDQIDLAFAQELEKPYPNYLRLRHLQYMRRDAVMRLYRRERLELYLYPYPKRIVPAGCGHHGHCHDGHSHDHGHSHGHH